MESIAVLKEDAMKLFFFFFFFFQVISLFTLFVHSLA